MLYAFLCLTVVLYTLSVIGSYQVLSHAQNNSSIVRVLALVGRDPLKPFADTDLLYFFATPWIPFINTYLLYRTAKDNPEISIQITYLLRSIKKRLLRWR